MIKYALILLTAELSIPAKAAFTEATSGGRPVAAALEELETRSGVRISYEDTVYLNDADIQDVTGSVARDRGASGRRVYVPKTRTIHWSYAAPLTATDVTTKSAALFSAKMIVSNFEKIRGVTMFSVEPWSGGIHVIARTAIDRRGFPVRLKPALDQLVTLPGGQLSVAQALKIILTQVSAGPIKVGFLTSPLSQIDQTKTQLAARRVPARQVLEKLLDIGNANLNWHLYCGTTHDQICLLNIYVPQRQVSTSALVP